MTEVRLMPSEFDDYHIGVDTAITFCLKELRVASHTHTHTHTQNGDMFLLIHTCSTVHHYLDFSLCPFSNQAILLFTDALPHTLSVHFESAGKSVSLSLTHTYTHANTQTHAHTLHTHL